MGIKHTIHGDTCPLCKKGMASRPKFKNRLCHKCRDGEPPEGYKCHGTTAAKKPCRQWAIIGTDWCRYHKPKE